MSQSLETTSSSTYNAEAYALDLNVNALKNASQSVSLTLPDGQVLTATLDRFEPREGYIVQPDGSWSLDPNQAQQSFLWLGTTNYGQPLILTAVADNTCGEIIEQNNGSVNHRYMIEPSGTLGHTLFEVDTSYFGDDLDLNTDNSKNEITLSAAETAGFVHEPIKISALYTLDALNGAGGNTNNTAPIESCIYNAVDQMNFIYRNSGVTVNGQVINNYFELQSTGLAYENSQPVTDKSMIPGYSYLRLNPFVHGFRSQTDSDLIVLVTEYDADQKCGFTERPRETQVNLDFEDRGYEVVRRTCSVANYNFTHEVSHSLSACHQFDLGGPSGEFGCNQGGHAWYVNGDFRTVMSGDSSCPDGCPNIPRLANVSDGFGFGAVTKNVAAVSDGYETVWRYRPFVNGSVAIQQNTNQNAQADKSISPPDFRTSSFDINIDQIIDKPMYNNEIRLSWNYPTTISPLITNLPSNAVVVSGQNSVIISMDTIQNSFSFNVSFSRSPGSFSATLTLDAVLETESLEPVNDQGDNTDQSVTVI